MILKRLSIAAAIVATTLVSATTAIAAPISLDGMGIISQWTDYENQAGDMPANIWGTSDATSEDRIGLHVIFANGLEGSVTYSGVSGLWNTHSGFSLAFDNATGFFTAAGGLHHLHNDTWTLPMAWTSFVMPFSNNFDLDYAEYLGSNFRASTAGWGSAVFTTYSSAVSGGRVPRPSLLGLLGLGLIGIGAARRMRWNK